MAHDKSATTKGMSKAKRDKILSGVVVTQDEFADAVKPKKRAAKKSQQADGTTQKSA